MKETECCTCFTELIWFQYDTSLTHRRLFKLWKTATFAARFKEKVPSRKKSLSGSRLWNRLLLQTWFGPFGLIDCLHHCKCLWCQKLNLTRVRHGSAAMRSAAMMKHAPQLSCQMLKMGSSGHSGSTQGVHAWKVVEADGWKAHWGRPDVIRLLRWGWAPPLCSTGCLSISRTSSREIIGATSVTPLCL